MIHVFIVLLYILANCECTVHKNNVCKYFEDYATLYDNQNCWYNPDVDSSPKFIAKRLGYPFETYTVISPDGYYLTIYRIFKRTEKIDSTNISKSPVVIQHGLAGSSAFWVLQGNRSIAFMLADNGYDVWMLNARGTHYSTKHKTLNIVSPEFWKFGFHDIAVNDIPTCIDFITKKTNQKGNLIYIGHSMGTTISYVYATHKKKHADENLKAIISLAPVAYMKHVSGGFKTLAPGFTFLSRLIRSFGMEAVGHFYQLQPLILRVVCGHFPLISTCSKILDLFTGSDTTQLQPEILPVFLSYYPSGTSLKTLDHFVQMINTGEFGNYDYGSKKNFQIYNKYTPPDYNVTQIDLPVYLFVGDNDVVGNLQDAEILKEKINKGRAIDNAPIFTFPMAHNDFFLGRSIESFYEKLLEVLKFSSSRNK